MEIKDFVKDNKLIIPVEEIDNVYLWTRVSKTQEVLIPTKSYFTFLEHGFKEDVERVKSLIVSNNVRFKKTDYVLADFITFTKNLNKLVTSNYSVVYGTNPKLLETYLMFLAHKTIHHTIKNESILTLLLRIIDDKDYIKSVLDSDILLLELYSAPPEHKYLQTLYELIISSRCKSGKHTAIYTVNTNLIINPNAIQQERADLYGIVNLDPMIRLLEKRRESDYKQLMSDWISCMKLKEDLFVYSKEEPKQKFRIVDRYKS